MNNKNIIRWRGFGILATKIQAKSRISEPPQKNQSFWNYQLTEYV